jgi:hypothetical protein
VEDAGAFLGCGFDFVLKLLVVYLSAYLSVTNPVVRGLL